MPACHRLPLRMLSQKGARAAVPPGARAVLLAALLLTVTGCGPTEEPAPATPTAEEQTAKRVEMFGPAAAAKDIAWRSSGLGIRILTPGDGASPQGSDRVRVNYTGRLKDGRVFDDSRARGKPGEFVVNQLIPGWAAAMPSLKVGGHAEFFIPPSLGYGGLKVGNIPPVSGLIFDVELLAINPESPPKKAEVPAESGDPATKPGP